MDRFLAKRIRDFIRAFISDPLAHWPFIPMSRQLCGNTAGAKQNLYGSSQLAYFRLFGRRDGKKATDPWVLDNARVLRREGVLKLETPIVPVDTIKLIQRKFDQKAKASTQANEYIVSFGGEDIVKDVPEVFDIMKCQRLRELIQEFFASAFHVDQIVYRRTFPVPDQVLRQGEIYSDYWHCDSSPTSEIALFINLIDIAPDCGPTMVVDKNHSSSLIRKYYRGRRNKKTVEMLDSALEQGGYAQAFTGQAGSMLFAQTTKCLHRASIPAEGKMRDWLSFRFLPKSAPIVADRIIRNRVLHYTHGLDV